MAERPRHVVIDGEVLAWNARVFGAKGDGVADDTAAVQSAIDHEFGQRMAEPAEDPGARLYDHAMGDLPVHWTPEEPDQPACDADQRAWDAGRRGETMLGTLNPRQVTCPECVTKLGTEGESNG